MENNLGDWIRRNRGVLEWTQEDLASKVGTSKKSIGRWERGESTPNSYARKKLESTFRKALGEDLEPIPSVLSKKQKDQISSIEYIDSESTPAMNEREAIDNLEGNSASVPEMLAYQNSGAALTDDILLPLGGISDEVPLTKEREDTLPAYASPIPAPSSQSSMRFLQERFRGGKFRGGIIFVAIILIVAIVGGGIISQRNSTSRWWPVVDAAKEQAPYQSSRVKVIQWMLVFHKQPKTQTSYLAQAEVDGFAGSITQQAVKNFQTDNNLLSTGTVDKPTWEKLIPVSQENDHGEQVKALQEILNVNPFSAKLIVDGIYGPLTEQAVEQFQTRVGLHKTGIADLDTWCELVGGQLRES